MSIIVSRIGNHPIIYPGMDSRIGNNINGPAIVKMPDWAAGSLGSYHLYFSDHKGKYIRLAYSDDVAGPWRIYSPGALHIKDSLFEKTDPPEPPIEDRPEWSNDLKGGYLYAHIASPDIHVDHNNQCMWMYYHGLLKNGDQQTRVACSKDGLKFKAYAHLLGPPYFRCFWYNNHIYALTWGGDIWRSNNWRGPFSKGPNITVRVDNQGNLSNRKSDGFRHGDVFRCADTLHIFYTRIGDSPESILHTRIQLTDDWLNWTTPEPSVILRPELPWEGTELPLEKSTIGGISKRMRELRDPCIFEDTDGKTYLLYCGAGESGIGIATIALC